MQFSASQIAPLISGVIEGDASVLVSNFGKIESAQPGDLAFLANPKYESFAYTTKASILLVANTFAPRLHGISPKAHIADDVELGEDVYVAPFAVIEPGAKIGRGCQVHSFAYIGRGVTLGEGTVIYPQVTLYHGVQVGARCIIHAGAVLGSDGFGFAPEPDGYHKIPQLGSVLVEDDVEIGANTCIDRAVMDNTVIRRGVKLDNLIQIAHNCEVGEHTVMASQVGLAGSSAVGKWCRFGGQVGIGGHLTIGDRVEMAGQTGVLGNVASGTALMGSPGMPLREAMRSFVIQPKLPDMYRRLQALEKELAELKKQL